MTWGRARFLLASVLALVFSAPPGWATTLQLNFVDTDGRPVQVAKAELLLVAWGHTERIELETSGDVLSLSLDPDWLRSRWQRFDDHMGVYLYLQAPPLAAIRSHCFTWPGANAAWMKPCGAGQDSSPTVISFPGNRQAVVEEGTDTHMTLAFRPQVSRRVRIVDPGGAPLPGVAVEASMFWSHFNRAGVLDGAEPLSEQVTNADGWIEIGDGDFEYVLELPRSTHVFVEPNDQALPWRMVTHLPELTTEVAVYPFAVRPLELRVLRGVEPVAGVHLCGNMDKCHGAGCWGILATTDESGRLELDEFRPESWSSIWLLVDEAEFWRTTPTSLPVGIVEVQLPTRAGVDEHRPPP